MTHITLSKKTSSKPCLEFYSDGSGERRRVTIEQFPFRIGRAETAHLRIESAEVSREHAELVERNGICLVRDLGSTNGTKVNGKPIQETLLADGDILQIAEIELTFIASAASQFQRMLTQPIAAKKTPAALHGLPPFVAAMRATSEATLWQVLPAQLLAARSMRQGVTDSYFAPLVARDESKACAEQPGPVVEHYRELLRRCALEMATNEGEASRLFVGISSSEFESPQRLFEKLEQLQDLLPAGWELGVTISLPTDVDILRITDVYRQARERYILVAFDEFQGNGGQVMHLKSLLPDYLIVASSMMKDLATSRQPLRRLESLVAACDELAVKPVLPKNDAGHGVALCQEIGFDLMLQPAHCKVRPRAELSVTV